MKTLPDYVKPGLDIVFIGINPGEHSARVGHYFASPRNRFWPSVNRSGLFTEELGPRTDMRALDYGIGFTDVVKRPSSSASKLRAADYREWAPVLKEKIERFKPLIACFHGAVGYRNFLKYVEDEGDGRPAGGREAKVTELTLGPQDRNIGGSRVFLIPNPSPANAQYSLDDLAGWYRRLKKYRDELKSQ